MVNKVQILYHADCMDGYAAAWSAWKAFGQQADYRAVHHYSPLPDFPEGAVLYILDFCYPMAELLAAAKKASRVIVLDHHISAQKSVNLYLEHANFPENIEIYFNQKQSGCMIAWHYFHADISPPVLLEHIQDHDLWMKILPQTEAICKALYLRLPLRFSAFEKIKLASLKQEGAVLLKQHELSVRRLFKARHKMLINNISGLAVNAPPVFSSDLGHALAKKSGTFGMTYFYHGQRRCYECGLRSIGDFDVSVLAQQFGGGGHKNAAGFSIEMIEFFELMS